MAQLESKRTLCADEENPGNLDASAAIAASTAPAGPIESEKDVIPPQDGGKGAWLFLIGACIIEGVTWGEFVRDRTDLLLSV